MKEVASNKEKEVTGVNKEEVTEVSPKRILEIRAEIEKQKRMRKSYEEFPNKRQATDSYGFNDWLVARDKIGKRII